MVRPLGGSVINTARSVALSRVAPASPFDSIYARRRPVNRIDSPFKRDVLAGLSRPQKSVPCTWLYDQRGSELFEAIARLPEYYLTRSETAILETCAQRVGVAVGPGATLVELGSGCCRKTALLLAALLEPAAYVPIDVSIDYLAVAIHGLRAAFPRLPIHPVIGDINEPSTLTRLGRMWRVGAASAQGTEPAPASGRRLAFIPGSMIGNFEHDAAVALLARLGQVLGEDSMLLVGVDSTQDRSRLLPAYDDHQGVTAAFNRNLLVRINRELEGNFRPDAFEHQARFNMQLRRVEMHLVSRIWATFEVCGRAFVFAAGESIHTQNSYKLTHARLRSLAQSAGWLEVNCWPGASSNFAVHLLERAGDR